MNKLISKALVVSAICFLTLGGFPIFVEDLDVESSGNEEVTTFSFGQQLYASPHETTSDDHTHTDAFIACQTTYEVICAHFTFWFFELVICYIVSIDECWGVPENPLHAHGLSPDYNDISELVDLGYSCLAADEVLKGDIEFSTWTEDNSYLWYSWETQNMKAVASNLACHSIDSL